MDHRKESETDKKPSILMVANWDSGVGYAWWLMESYWVALAKHHQKSHRAVIAYPSISTIPDSIRDTQIRAELLNFKATTIRDVARQCRFIREHNVDTVYLSDQTPSHWRYLAWRLAGVKVIVTHDHTPGLRSAPQSIKRLLKIALRSLPGITVNAAIGATEYVRNRLIEVGCFPPHKTHAAPNGLPQGEVHTPAEVHAMFGIPRGRTIIVTTGRAAPIKNLGFALRCIEQLSSDGVDVHLLHCGDGPDLEKLKQQAAELGVTDRVTFAGKRSDVPAILPACDIAMQPSRGEVGYSLSILEYMQAGLPVVVPNNPSVCGATVSGLTGLIYREDDLQDACRQFVQLVSDGDLRARIGESGRMAVTSHYSLDTSHAALTAVFDGLSVKGAEDREYA